MNWNNRGVGKRLEKRLEMVVQGKEAGTKLSLKATNFYENSGYLRTEIPPPIFMETQLTKLYIFKVCNVMLLCTYIFEIITTIKLVNTSITSHGYCFF